MIHMLLFLISLCGFTLLLFATARHQQEWLKRKLPVRTALQAKVGGLTLLVLALFVAARGVGWAQAPLFWCGWMSLCAGLVVAAQCNRERLLRLLERKQR